MRQVFNAFIIVTALLCLENAQAASIHQEGDIAKVLCGVNTGCNSPYEMERLGQAAIARKADELAKRPSIQDFIQKCGAQNAHSMIQSRCENRLRYTQPNSGPVGDPFFLCQVNLTVTCN